MTSRELVYKTLDFDRPTRVPRDLWALPWAKDHFGDQLAQIKKEYPDDLVGAPELLATPTISQGDAMKIGTFVDEWGATFVQIADGHIGEVKRPLISDDTWEETTAVHFPRERLTFDRHAVNQFARESQGFVLSPNLARPFERLQFLRGSENLYVDLADPPSGFLRFIQQLHAFSCELIEEWAKTDVDGIAFMDDWGAQQSLLINPTLWRELFKPLYKDYISIAHDHGKRAFMHSDGHTLAILPDLIELGLDALNSQIFCMGVAQLAPFAGKITFWGEIDRQHLLARGSESEVRAAVREVYANLWHHGGCIGQCEFGPGAKPENVRAVFQEWDRVTE
jgi:hypothetical protein